MDFWITCLLSGVSLLFLLYFYVQQKFSYWAKLGIPGPKPSLLTLGNSAQIFSQNPYKLEQQFRGQYGKVYGNYRGFQPVLAVADPELIKQVMVKDFHLFVDQQEIRSSHPVANRIVFFESSPNWKRLRAITTPCFSSGKLRHMFSQMDQSVQQLVAHLDQLTKHESGLIKDAKQVMVGFTLDVIASNVFGVQTNSNNSSGRNLSNPFLVNAVKLFDVTPLKAIAISTFPIWLNSKIGIRQPFNDDSWDFFEKLAKEILRQRRTKQSGKRNDLIEILINAQVDESALDNDSYDKLEASNLDEETENSHSTTRTNKSTLTEEEIVAQAIGFMVGGYDSVASALTSCVYELAINPTVQERLHDELEQSLADKETDSTEYNETVMQIPYLDAVLKESMRMYPPFTRIGRRFVGSPQPYKLGYTGVVLHKHQLVEFPTLNLHYNAEYFPEPNRFNPDRFMPENKDSLVPYSFIPFGTGPRNCIGLRFAMQEMKLCLAKVCRIFRFAPTAKTPPSPAPLLPYKLTLGLDQIEIRVERR